MTAPEYPYPSVLSTAVPDRTDTGLIAHLAAQVQEQLANPAGSQVLIAEVSVNVGNLIDDPAAQAAVGAAAQALHTKVRGE